MRSMANETADVGALCAAHGSMGPVDAPEVGAGGLRLIREDASV